jgi:hypothetical protein
VKVLRSLRIDEISAVDKPAQKGAQMLIMKGHSDMSQLQKCIAAAKRDVTTMYKTSDPTPGFTNRDFEKALDEYVASKKQQGESHAAAYDRLLKEDDTAADLAFASYNAVKVPPV